MRLTGQPIYKTRNILGREMEMQVAQLKGGEHVGQFQATYYDLAEPVIWGECFPTMEEAANDCDKLVDKHLV